MENINIDKLEQLLNEGYAKIQPAEGKSIVLVIGNTGSGKSSIAQDMILNILNWYYKYKTEDIKLSIIYFY